MLAVDFRINYIKAKHRISLFRLAKIEFGDFEPVYAKISEVVDVSQSDTRPSVTPFGTVMLIADSEDIVKHISSEVVLRVEIYNDAHGPLDLIAAGETPLQLTMQSVESRTPRAIDDIRSRWFSKLGQIRAVSLPIKHFAQGLFKISAGEVNVSVTVYRLQRDALHDDVNGFHLDLNKGLAEKTAAGSALETEDDDELPPPPPPPLDLLETAVPGRIDIPDVLTAEEINARLGFVNIASLASVVDESLEENEKDDASDVNTTREDDWWGELVAREEDTDSVDEFVDRFLRTHRPRSGSDDTDRSNSPPPPPPPPRKPSATVSKPSVARRGTTRTKPPSHKHRQTPTYSSKPTRIAPQLIGAAADRGRWLFAKPSFP